MVLWIFRGRIFWWYREWDVRLRARVILPLWEVVIFPFVLFLWTKDIFFPPEAEKHLPLPPGVGANLRLAVREVCAAFADNRRAMAVNFASILAERQYWGSRFRDSRYLAQQWARDINARLVLDINAHELEALIDPDRLFYSSVRISKYLEALEESRL